MPLDKSQIKIIADDVNRAAIMINDLRDELLDHLCCEVEMLMTEGKTFDEAYSQISKSVTIETLKSIEEKTIQLTDKNYLRMKNLMRISGNISLILVTAGTMMKIFDVTGWTIILTLAFAILCLCFLPLTLYTYRSDSANRKNRELKVAIFMAGLFFPLGILFRTMQWQGANILLALSFFVILLGALPLTWIALKEKYQEKNERQLHLFGLISVSIFIVAIAFKLFHFPGAAVLLIIGSIMLVSIYLPIYTYREFKKTNTISAQFIYLIIASIYIVTMVALMSFGSHVADLQNLVTKN